MNDPRSTAGGRAPDGETLPLTPLLDAFAANPCFATRGALVEFIARAEARARHFRASLAVAEQSLLTAHEDRAKAEGERDALRAWWAGFLRVCDWQGIVLPVSTDAYCRLDAALRPDGGGTT